jgi:hypothetical protein
LAGWRQAAAKTPSWIMARIIAQNADFLWDWGGLSRKLVISNHLQGLVKEYRPQMNKEGTDHTP